MYYFIFIFFYSTTYSMDMETKVMCLLEENQSLSRCLEKPEEIAKPIIKIERQRSKRVSVGLLYSQNQSILPIRSFGLVLKEPNPIGHHAIELSFSDLLSQVVQTSDSRTYQEIYGEREVDFEQFSIGLFQYISIYQKSNFSVDFVPGLNWQKFNLLYRENFEDFRINGELFANEFSKGQLIALNIGLLLRYKWKAISFSAGFRFLEPLIEIDRSFSSLVQRDQVNLDNLAQSLLNSSRTGFIAHLSYLF